MDLTEYYSLCVSLERVQNGLLLLGTAPPGALADAQRRAWREAVDALAGLQGGLEDRLNELQDVLEGVLRAEGAGSGAEVDELRGRLAAAAALAAEREETIGRMTAVGRRLVRERDGLRSRVLQADHTLARLKAAAEAQGVSLGGVEVTGDPPGRRHQPAGPPAPPPASPASRPPSDAPGGAADSAA